MSNNTHIWRKAACFIERYGDDAALQAALEVDHLAQQGDQHAADEWTLVFRAIKALQDQHPRGMTH